MESKKRMGTEEAAAFLGRSPGAVRNLVMRRAIPYRKVAGRLVFLRHELIEWIEGSPGLRPDELDINAPPTPMA